MSTPMPAPLPMSLTRRTLLKGAALAMAGVAGPVRSNVAADDAQSVPAAVRAALPQARLIGQGRLRFLGLLIYDARLWAGPSFAPAQWERHPLALELRYARAFAGADIARRSLTEMRRGHDIDDATAAAWVEAMRQAFPDVAAGDSLLGLYRPGGAAGFLHNATVERTVADPAFGPAFFGIWIAPWTSEPGLRSALLAGAERVQVAQ